MYMYIYIHTQMYMCVYVYIYVCVCMCLCMCVCMHICIYYVISQTVCLNINALYPEGTTATTLSSAISGTQAIRWISQQQAYWWNLPTTSCCPTSTWRAVFLLLTVSLHPTYSDFFHIPATLHIYCLILRPDLIFLWFCSLVLTYPVFPALPSFLYSFLSPSPSLSQLCSC